MGVARQYHAMATHVETFEIRRKNVVKLMMVIMLIKFELRLKQQFGVVAINATKSSSDNSLGKFKSLIFLVTLVTFLVTSTMPSGLRFCDTYYNNTMHRFLFIPEIFYNQLSTNNSMPKRRSGVAPLLAAVYLISRKVSVRAKKDSKSLVILPDEIDAEVTICSCFVLEPRKLGVNRLIKVVFSTTQQQKQSSKKD